MPPPCPPGDAFDQLVATSWATFARQWIPTQPVAGHADDWDAAWAIATRVANTHTPNPPAAVQALLAARPALWQRDVDIDDLEYRATALNILWLAARDTLRVRLMALASFPVAEVEQIYDPDLDEAHYWAGPP